MRSGFTAYCVDARALHMCGLIAAIAMAPRKLRMLRAKCSKENGVMAGWTFTKNMERLSKQDGIILMYSGAARSPHPRDCHLEGAELFIHVGKMFCFFF